MHVAQKALWLIESRLGRPLSLEGLAVELDVTAFHLARAFSKEFGRPPRTFRQQHQQGPIGGLEAILMAQDPIYELEPPRVVALEALRLVGLARRYNELSSAQIPDQWAEFNQLNIVQAEGEATYGVCYNADAEGNLDYLCGVAVTGFDGVDAQCDRLTIPAQTYAVFSHSGHVSEIRQVWQAIWNQGLPAAGLTASEGPEFEKYAPSFDPITGNGGFEIWIPVKLAG